MRQYDDNRRPLTSQELGQLSACRVEGGEAQLAGIRIVKATTLLYLPRSMAKMADVEAVKAVFIVQAPVGVWELIAW